MFGFLRVLLYCYDVDTEDDIGGGLIGYKAFRYPSRIWFLGKKIPLVPRISDRCFTPMNTLQELLTLNHGNSVTVSPLTVKPKASVRTTAARIYIQFIPRSSFLVAV